LSKSLWDETVENNWIATQAKLIVSLTCAQLLVYSVYLSNAR